MAEKKAFIVNVNADIAVEAYSAVGAEMKVREALSLSDWDINRIIVVEEEDD